MVKWLRNFWYQDLPDEMQRKMLVRPRLMMFTKRMTIPQKRMTFWPSYRQHG
jgi:hypothetical protein